MAEDIDHLIIGAFLEDVVGPPTTLTHDDLIPAITHRPDGDWLLVRRKLEPCLEPVFHADSYGYRPGRSAIDAVRQARQRCWHYDWVLDIDLKGYFDSIDWALLLKAIRHHTDCPWVLLYIERWLKVPVQMEDGIIVSRRSGTPQGGLITPRTQKVTFGLRASIAVCW